MLLREVEYARPTTLEEAVRLLSEHDGARALAGGQTLVNVMKQRAASPDVLVDLGGLDELRSIGFSADESALEIGAMVTLTSLIGRSSEVDVARPMLAEVARTVADVQVRNRGTLGGNICVNDPTNHFPPLLVALGASMTIRSASAASASSRPRSSSSASTRRPSPRASCSRRISVPTRAPGHRRRDGGRHARRARHVRRERRRDRHRTVPGGSRSAASRPSRSGPRPSRSGSTGAEITDELVRRRGRRARRVARPAERRPRLRRLPRATSPRCRSSAPSCEPPRRAKG